MTHSLRELSVGHPSWLLSCPPPTHLACFRIFDPLQVFQHNDLVVLLANHGVHGVAETLCRVGFEDLLLKQLNLLFCKSVCSVRSLAFPFSHNSIVFSHNSIAFPFSTFQLFPKSLACYTSAFHSLGGICQGR